MRKLFLCGLFRKKSLVVINVLLFSCLLILEYKAVGTRVNEL
jgi:hypothetical protein